MHASRAGLGVRRICGGWRGGPQNTSTWKLRARPDVGGGSWQGSGEDLEMSSACTREGPNPVTGVLRGGGSVWEGDRVHKEQRCSRKPRKARVASHPQELPKTSPEPSEGARPGHGHDFRLRLAERPRIHVCSFQPSLWFGCPRTRECRVRGSPRHGAGGASGLSHAPSRAYRGPQPPVSCSRTPLLRLPAGAAADRPIMGEVPSSAPSPRGVLSSLGA